MAVVRENENEPSEDRRLDVLYVTYDGLLEPLGRSQVLGYLKGVAASGLSVGILSFEKPGDLRKGAEREALERELRSRGILWKPLRYDRHPRAAAKAWDIVKGTATALGLSRRHEPAVVHARSYVAGLIAMAVREMSGARLLFDMRGFWPEERVELGLFTRNGSLYRAAKLLERHLLRTADHVVVLTESAKALLKDREARTRLASGPGWVRETPVTVVPCCVDLDRYRPMPRDTELSHRHGLDSSLLIGNLGAFNGRYMTAEMFRFAFHLKTHRPELRFVYLTAHPGAAVRAAAREAGLREEDVLVHRAAPEEVPRWLSLFRLGVFFLRPSYAAKASSFTKLGEFLASGVPVVTNTGVGDVDRILGNERCGLLLPGLTDRDLAAFARSALPLLEGPTIPDRIRQNCREAAVAHFALDEGVRRYRAVYDALLSPPLGTETRGVPAEVR
jgi:glycosyltransferase involved in cell wall biosynthesis